MLKSILVLSAAILFFGIVPAPGAGRMIPQAAPAQAAAPVAEPKAPLAPDTKNPVTPTAASQAMAKQVYARDCALCHGDNGNGQTDIAKGMDLKMADWTDPKTLAAKQDGELFDIIRSGWDKMPPEDAPRANDNEVWNLVIYIRSLSKGTPAAPATPAN